MKCRRTTLLLSTLLVLVIATGVMLAQRGGRGRRANYQTDRPDRNGTLDWELDKENPKDVFTFARVKYDTGGGYGYRGWGNRFLTDWPDADVNLAFRLQQMTSLKVHPDGVILELTDKELFDHPFIYIVEPGDLLFSDEEVSILRRYLLNGGFLMVDDFWGEREWENFHREIKRVFPDRELADLPMNHPVFHSVYDLKLTKNELQIPSIHVWQGSRVTWERWDAKEVHIRGIFDDKGRLMVVACHNTDNGDGWEREGEDEEYFRIFSEKIAYPLTINILFYAMTH